MTKNSYAVKVRDVKKSFYLPHHKNNSLKSTITQAFKSKEKGGEILHALDGISFNIEKGDFFGILGRNGSGKSTLLKIISEIYQPTSGSVRHNGRLVSFIELGVGFKSELTGRENIFLNSALLGFSKEEIEGMYDEIVEFAELERFMDQKLKNYSSGMKVRLAFSVAIRAKADILVLDEVLAVGDAAFQKKCNDYFETLKDDGKTVILVTHSMSAVRKYCNKAVVIDQGKVIYDGDAEAAAQEYLSLFNMGAKDEEEEGQSEIEQLDKRVTIEDVRVACTSKQLDITIELKSEVRQDGVKLAVRVLNSKKDVVAGVNTQGVLNPIVIDFTASNVKKVKFTSPNLLGEGKFSIDVRVGPVVVTGALYDKAVDVAHFKNSKPEGYYPVVLPACVEVYDS